MRTSLWLYILLLACGCGEQTEQKKVEQKQAAPDPHSGHMKSSGGSSKYVDQVNSGEIKEDTLKGSPRKISMSNVGDVHVHITYSSPGVKGRTIWGGLVPYDQVWVAGAHKATSVNINGDIEVEGKTIPAGTYAFFAIPGKTYWVLILNKNYEQHLTDDYDAAQDVVRIKVKPQAVALTPRLIYAVEELSSNKGLINLQWEKIKVSLPFTIHHSTK
ncbi:DUF2911 domain-containing protein [Pseudoflavitalea sp. G-6-1-2]|uniref:DUF2911 domain-containing protein n=1 Tax=Pseudoflavitalea sp. G-6-1-2 TaxID=2728841 RepID=UPI00146F5B37|nr:DUF2911 domain-containing protein [Pseudoflavitalea sp. G-6-1-2]NML21966.1 DUF2911 domain-containing protein [Pseudoflavitalea sp. G-6-1-2]